jgi:biopolymer transport protein ExbD
MAKRELQEINAGSMADIAFLLLIFFLVTTTMDKDTAFIRSIPKKVVVKDPVPVEERNILSIKANNQNQLMVRGEIFNDPNKISEFILKFYQTNELQNDPTNNFPMYSTATAGMIEGQLASFDKQIEDAENIGAPKEMIEFFENSLREWEKKKTSLRLLGGSELREIAGQAHVRIEVQQATEYSIFAKIQTEIEEALYEMRNDRSMKLWGIPYGVLKRKVALEKDKARDEKAKLDLLEILYPARIIEVTPKK